MKTVNSSETLPSSTLLARGEVKEISLLTGERVLVKVRLLPERHLNRFLDLRDVGREADLLGFVLQRNTAPAGAEPIFAMVNLADPAEATAQEEFVDSIESTSFAQLIEIADKLNFARAVSQAERQIATGNALLDLKTRIASTMLSPIEHTLRSLTSSLTTQISQAAGSKLPATSPSPGSTTSSTATPAPKRAG